MIEIVRLNDKEFRAQEGREVLFQASLNDLIRWIEVESRYIHAGMSLTGEELIDAIKPKSSTPIAIPARSKGGRSVD